MELNLALTISANDQTLTVGDQFDPRKEVTAKDHEDGDLTEAIEILTNEVDTPKTGDEANAMLWGSVLLVSLLAGYVVYRKLRRSRRSRTC